MELRLVLYEEQWGQIASRRMHVQGQKIHLAQYDIVTHLITCTCISNAPAGIPTDCYCRHGAQAVTPAQQLATCPCPTNVENHRHYNTICICQGTVYQEHCQFAACRDSCQVNVGKRHKLSALLMHRCAGMLLPHDAEPVRRMVKSTTATPAPAPRGMSRDIPSHLRLPRILACTTPTPGGCPKRGKIGPVIKEGRVAAPSCFLSTTNCSRPLNYDWSIWSAVTAAHHQPSSVLVQTAPFASCSTV